MTTDNTEILSNIRDYYEKLHINKMYSLYKIHKFLESFPTKTKS